VLEQNRQRATRYCPKTYEQDSAWKGKHHYSS
jgi:hypothetical protein